MAKKRKSAYTGAGVSLSAAEETMRLIKPLVLSTHNQYTLSGFGAFVGLFDASPVKHMRNPIIAQSVDGVGTKVKISKMTGRWTVGQCLVNHHVNDILTVGAKPLTFLNCIATAKLEPKAIEAIVRNIAVACKNVGTPILCGETAEMPGIYQNGQYDVVGFITGVVEKNQLIDDSKIIPGDVLIGLWSNGLHTNGYSLAGKAFFETANFDINTHVPKLGCTIGEELLKIHKCYFKAVYPLLGISTIEIHGIAHITGGGLIDNIARLLPEGLCAEIIHEWKIPPVFKLIQEIEKVSDEEMRRVFNLGIGMVLIVPFEHVKRIRGILAEYGEPNHILIGTIKKTRSKKKKVVFTY